VQNQTRDEYRITASVVDLAPRSGQSESVEFTEPGEAERGIGSWTSVAPKAFELAAGTERLVAIRIRVPADAGAGGWYGAIQIRVTPTDPPATIQVTPEVPVVLLVTVAGEIKRKLDVSVSPSSRFFWRGGDAEWTVRMKNDGDVHENVSGTLRLEGLVAADARVRLDAGILLPGEERTRTYQFELRDSPDVLQATARVTRDDAPRVNAQSRRAIVIPWWILALICIAAAIITWRRRRIRVAERMNDDFSIDFDDSSRAG
jgi:hypothetical protein